MFSPIITRLSTKISVLRCLAGIILTISVLKTFWVIPAEVKGAPLSQSGSTNVHDELLAEAENEGEVRVLVGFNVPAAYSEVVSASADAVLQQQVLSAQNQIISALDLTSNEINHQYSHIPSMSLTIDAEKLHALMAHPVITSVEPVRLYEPLLTESTTLIGADEAWAAGFTGNGQIVVIIDSGVETNHPALAGKVVSEACYSTTDSSRNAQSMCPGLESTGAGTGETCVGGAGNACEHGTHVAGIATNTDSLNRGVAPNSRLISIQVFSQITNTTGCQVTNKSAPNYCECGGEASPCIRAFEDDIVDGLNQVRSLVGTFNIAAVNLSLGSGEFKNSCDTRNSSMTTSIDMLRNAGVVTVIASGNDSYTDALSSLACIRSAVSVGSIDDGSGLLVEDQVSSFSNSSSLLDLLAPGNSIVSTVSGGSFSSNRGTSMAAPHVAGAIAVLREAKPSATVDDMVAVLKCTGVSIRDARNGLIKPRVQVNTAIELLNNTSTGVVYLDQINGDDSDNGDFRNPVERLSRAASLVPSNGIILSEPAVYDSPIVLDKQMIICGTEGGATRQPVVSAPTPGAPPSSQPETPNQAPVALTDYVNTVSSRPVIIDVLSNDSDLDDHNLSVVAVEEPIHGSATFEENNVTYLPEPDFYGLDEFSYTISDNNGGFASGTIEVSVQLINSRPIANDDYYVVSQEVAVLKVTFNDSNPNDDSLTISSVSKPENGDVMIDGTKIVYTSNIGFNGYDHFTYTLLSNESQTSEATVTVFVTEIADRSIYLPLIVH